MPEQLHPDTHLVLTQDLISQIKLQKSIYDQQYPKSVQNFDTSDQIEYYLLSTKFLDAWNTLVTHATNQQAPNQQQNCKTPPSMNSELILAHLDSFDQVQLKHDIKQGIDYVFVNKTVMDIFQNYPGQRIPRMAYYDGVAKLVQRFPLKFSFAFISRSWIQILAKQPESSLTLHQSLAYKNQTIGNLIDRMTVFSKKDKKNRKQENEEKGGKLYTCQSQGIKQYVSKLRQTIDSHKKDLEVAEFEPPGEQVRKDMIIGDLPIHPDNIPLILIELEESSWIYKSDSNSKHDYCEFCRKKKKLVVICKCKDAQYCSKECQDRDWRYHARSCEAQYQQDNEQPKFQFVQDSRRGLVGLQNIGNTCYMNSALQCLFHTRQLTNYFVGKLYIDEINEDNPIGSKGKVVKSYAKLIQSIMVTTEEVCAPYRFKFAVGKTKQMFIGYEQHDSQEFLLFLLDTLHEDLNRVKKKPYTNCIQNEGRPDYQVAKESWLTYLKRNQSYINDLMGGQYRSQVKCPDCQNISVTFDPFLIFSVPIPSTDQSKSINVYLFFYNYHKQTLKITLSSKQNNVRGLRQDLQAKAKVPLEQTKFFMLGFNGAIREVKDEESIDRLINEKQFNESGEQRQLFGLQMTPEELQNIENKKYLVFKLIDNFQKALTFKRPFPFDCSSKIRGADIYNRICQFLVALDRKIHYGMSQSQMKNKYMVYRQKVIQQKVFTIYMTYGQPKQDVNKLIYPERMEITEQTDVSELLTKNNYNVEFQVAFKNNPYYGFNTFQNYNSEKKWSSSHYHSGYGDSTGYEQSYTLEQCLEEMKKSEKLVEGNEVFCSKCHDLKLAEKKMELYKSSKYLIIQLRRFKQVGYEKSKNYAEIKYPLFLDLNDYLINHEIPQAYFIDHENKEQEFYFKPKYFKNYNAKKETRYRLYGVVNHSGSLVGGHYTAYAMHEEKWYKFDDSYIKQLDKPGWNCGGSAYILFYEKIESSQQWNPKSQQKEDCQKDKEENKQEIKQKND